MPKKTSKKKRESSLTARKKFLKRLKKTDPKNAKRLKGLIMPYDIGNGEMWDPVAGAMYPPC